MIDWKEAPDEQVVCYCQGIDKKTMVQSIRTGSNTLALVQLSTTACTGNRCRELNPSGKCCSEDILKLIAEYSEGDSAPTKPGCCCCT
jgi:NAD(P)H-nitrite reductase large subunit